jgi:uroporphyrin-III C-methyltransferase
MTPLVFSPFQPKLTLVGAGPGDPSLITVKGLEAIRQARVILYDALVNPELLRHASPNCLLRFVGKRAGLHLYTQQDINAMILKYVFSLGNVVRLKGGDPFVFGRGQEEINYVQKYRIETEVIPGISSALGVPGLNHIPVTARGVSEGFWVVTGTTEQGKLSRDLRFAIQADTTVVVLMGMRQLGLIAQEYATFGRQGTPAAIIQNGSLPNQIIRIATIGELPDIASEEGLNNPAVIVIGEVVRFHTAYRQSLQYEWAEALTQAI